MYYLQATYLQNKCIIFKLLFVGLHIPSFHNETDMYLSTQVARHNCHILKLVYTVRINIINRQFVLSFIFRVRVLQSSRSVFMFDELFLSFVKYINCIIGILDKMKATGRSTLQSCSSFEQR